MLISRTTGSASIVPELVYADVDEAVDWLCETFGFTEQWRAGGHRARVTFGNGTVIVADADAQYGRAVPDRAAFRATLSWSRWTTSTRITTTPGSAARGF